MKSFRAIGGVFWRIARSQSIMKLTLTQGGSLPSPKLGTLAERLVGPFIFSRDRVVKSLLFSVTATVISSDTIEARTWLVSKSDQFTLGSIQAGIDSEVNGDSLLVYPGLYRESISYKGKLITIASQGGRDVTIIDAQGSVSSVVLFNNHETHLSILDGFTITGGLGTVVDESVIPFGGGIFIDGSEPCIKNNIIRENSAVLHSSGRAAGVGGGIACRNLRPDLLAPRIISNTNANVAGDHGGGIYVSSGSGIVVGADIMQNTLWRNVAHGTENSLDSGGGIALGYTSSLVSHNTLSSNAGHGNGVWGGGIAVSFAGSSIIDHNIICNSPRGAGIVCSAGATPLIKYNLAWNNVDGDGYGTCSKQNGL